MIHGSDTFYRIPDDLELIVRYFSFCEKDYAVCSFCAPFREKKGYKRSCKTNDTRIEKKSQHTTISIDQSREEVFYDHHDDGEKSENCDIRQEEEKESFKECKHRGIGYFLEVNVIIFFFCENQLDF